MTLGDRQLFGGGVGGKLDDLHTVDEGLGNASKVVRRCDEHTVTKVKGELRKVIAEALVLFAVENLEKCGGGISVSIACELIYLVKKDNRVKGACLCYC